MMAEFRRLGALFDTWLDYQLAHGEAAMQKAYQKTRRSNDILTLVKPGGPRLSDVLEGTKQGLNDINDMIRDGLQEGWPSATGFLAYYRERTGREWWADAGDPVRMARAILKRGQIRDETEWYLLKNLLDPLDQTDLSADELKRLRALHWEFEEQARQ
ncbi:hypothetical protein FHG66_20775 [Rubellimicrobium rubrum]|uniref:Uncharacterized protein n=2 Tax=Rubellimicrobium rubrum TaxID=2585369 RepID=A0A5C4MKB7_9RHOB|nr:hypothetical protein FHG66_20775 [Rubellimicrobium rubrum]